MASASSKIPREPREPWAQKTRPPPNFSLRFSGVSQAALVFAQGCSSVPVVWLKTLKGDLLVFQMPISNSSRAQSSLDPTPDSWLKIYLHSTLGCHLHFVSLLSHRVATNFFPFLQPHPGPQPWTLPETS